MSDTAVPDPAKGITFLICGGGNGAHAFAGVAAKRGATVHVYTPFQSEVDKWNEGGLSITCNYATDGSSTTASPVLVTADAKVAAAGVDIAIVVLPTSFHENALMDVGPHLPEGAAIGTIEGAWWGRPPLGEGVLDKVTFFGLRTLPWAARIKDYGKSVEILGTKNVVELASSPTSKVGEVGALLERICGIKLPCCPNLLALFAIDPGNVIHPSVMYGGIKDWDGQPFDESPLFYQGIDDYTAEVMTTMDREVLDLKQKFLDRYPTLDLSDAVPTMTWLLNCYSDQIKDKSSMRTAFNTNAAYTGLRYPVKDAPDGSGKKVYDFDYRYLTSDVPYGIVVIKGIAEIMGHPTPMIDTVIEWTQKRLGKEWIVNGKITGKDLDQTRAPQKFGITTIEELMAGVGACLT